MAADLDIALATAQDQRMKTKILAAFTVSLVIQSAHADISFTGLPPVTSSLGASSQLAARRERVISTMAARPLTPPPTPPKVNLDTFAESMLGRMIERKDLARVSENLLHATAWNVGTSISILGSLCNRVGDYDFVLQPLLRMAYLDDRTPMLTPAARHKLRYELLNQRGIAHHISFQLDTCLPLSIQDSENHILMSEVARYLTNQLLYDDSVRAHRPIALYNNKTNGFDEWMLDHLTDWLRRDFNELNSKPYEGYTWIALDTLYSYARNEDVKIKAQMVLDYLSAKSAAQSIGLRRHPPYRRQLEHRDDDRLLEADTTMDILSVLTGAYSYLEMESPALQYRGNEYVAMMAATGTYEIPLPILDLFVNHDHPAFVRLKHRDLEIYASSKHFLLSAGGRYRTQLLSSEASGGIPFVSSDLNWLTSPNDQWAVSTTVIPARYGLKQSDLFRIDGPENWNKKNNLCVLPGFACGENLYVPPLPKSARVVTAGAWSFYDVSQSMGFYLAAYREANTPYAFIEVREPVVRFNDFVKTILSKNSSLQLRPDLVSTYITSRGHTIGFTPNSGELGIWPLRSYDGRALESDSSKWPMASGNVMRSAGDGLITIVSPASGARLILDDRNPRHPRRTLDQ